LPDTPRVIVFGGRRSDVAELERGNGVDTPAEVAIDSGD
jgi:hypothetical protein